MNKILTTPIVLFILFSPTCSIAAPVAPCAGRQLAIAKTALQGAKAAMGKALAALKAPSEADATRMTNWLGANSSPGPKGVQTALTNAIAFTGGVNFACDTDSDPQRYAYVLRGQEFKITLTKVFFDAQETGLSSRKGTIVHEISHFLIVGATADPAHKDLYGPTEAQNLARRDPAAAQGNAENIEYFVESTADGL